MKTDPNETLKKFGMDPKTILEKRRKSVSRFRRIITDNIGEIVGKVLDLCNEKGYGYASKLHIAHGCAEPPMLAMSIAISHPPDVSKCPGGTIPFDSALFAGLFYAASLEEGDVIGRPKDMNPNPLQAAHDMFERIRGYSFRDTFITTCGCANHKARRKALGIKLDADNTGRWL